jgi:hypothetical protein
MFNQSSLQIKTALRIVEKILFVITSLRNHKKIGAESPTAGNAQNINVF